MRYKVESLVVDTTAFIKNSNLQEIGMQMVTVQEVVDEITNKRQLRRLVVLPYNLQIKDVFPENIKHITEFSKKTGDYPSLSATDIKVMALTYQLEKELVGTEHLNKEPQVNRMVSFSNKDAKLPPEDTAGFHYPKKKKVNSTSRSSCPGPSAEKSPDTLGCSSEDDDDDSYSSVSLTEEDVDIIIGTSDSEDDNFEDAVEEVQNDDGVITENINIDDILVPVKKLSLDEDLNDSGKDVSDDTVNSEEEDEDDEGWITPSNIAKIKNDMRFGEEEETPKKVACITADFAMQNVMKQLGLSVLSVEGRMIQHLRTFILRCYACFKTTSIMTKVFCPHCGNKTLKKVSVSLAEDGTQVIHINPKRPLTSRGKRFSLPTPKGGKHANNPILCEDQRLPQQKASKLARMKNDPLAPDYIAGFSPFIMRDVNSRSAILGIRPEDTKHWMRRNPNEARRQHSKKKK